MGDSNISASALNQNKKVGVEHNVHKQFSGPTIRDATSRGDIPRIPIEWNTKGRIHHRRCVVPIKSQEELDLALRDFQNNDKLAIFKYVRHNCPACALVSIALEKVCKKYKNYPYLQFYELHEDKNPDLMAGDRGRLVPDGVPKMPYVTAALGSSTQSAVELHAEPAQGIRDLVLQRIQDNIALEKQMGREPMSKSEAQKQMIRDLITPTTDVIENNFMSLLAEFNTKNAHSYFDKLQPSF